MPALATALMLAAASMLVACDAQDTEGTSASERSPGDSSQSAPEATLPSALAGSSWQLVEFQSMDDSQGTTRPDDPSKYLMDLNADGTVALRLNCNRANGTWRAQSGADGTSGTFGFGPLAMTRALCPPPSMDEQIASQSEYVRGYLLRDGKLYLSLMADGGIYAWEPRAAEIPFETAPDARIEAAIRAASPDYTREIASIGNSMGRYLYSRVDLNDAGEDEVLVYLLGSIFCGTGGCNLQLFAPTEEGYSLVNEFPTTRTPVIVTSEKRNGWRTLWRFRSGGGVAATFIADRFDGEKYVDAEVVSADEPPAGTRVLSGEFTFQEGIPLEPLD